MKKTIFSVAVAVCAVAVMSSCGNNGLISKGNSSKLDTLSYALGSNIGMGMKYEMSDVPFDFKAITKGLDEAALGKAKQTQEEAIEILRDYFMNKRGERGEAIMAKRAQADSIRLAEGDSTKVEYPAADPDMFENEKERYEVSYAFGIDVGNNVKNSGLPIQLHWLDKGIVDVYEGNGKMSEDEINTFLQNYFMVVRPAEFAKKSAEWLEKIEKKSGVKKTESGLLYKVVKAGDEQLKATDDRDVVVVKYEGKTREGKVFDSSFQRVEDVEKRIAELKKNKDLTDEQKEDRLARLNDELKSVETAEFPLNRVIKGWTEGMKLVGKGGKITLWIPAEMAYGQRGAGRDIGPNEALQFDVEIVDVKPFAKPEPVEEEAVEESEITAEEKAAE